MFKKHAEDYPDSPWTDEALLHVGCDARYNGRYTEANGIFQQIIEKNKESKHYGAKMLLNKARSRLAILKLLQGNTEEAVRYFSQLKKDSPDWHHRTYASHWIQRISRYKANELALLNCGTEALAQILKKDGRKADALKVMNIFPPTLKGHSIKDLKLIAEKYGYSVKGLKLSIADMKNIPLPAILQIDKKNEGDSGHYWVFERIDDSGLVLFDPQSGRRFSQNLNELSKEWNGNAIVFSNRKDLPGLLLTETEMEQAYGGCCGSQRAPDNLGDPGANTPLVNAPGTGNPGNSNPGSDNPGNGNPDNSDCPDGYGSPVWKVNIINMNLYVTDIPLWYDSQIGPDVKIQLSYNSQSSIAQYIPFGNKWTFNYGSYLVEDTGDNITLFMPDGRNDVYTPDGEGGYIKPFGIFNTLTKIAENHFELEFLNGTVYVYEIPSGTSSLQPFLVEIRDVYGQSLTLAYNTNVLLETITDALGKVTTLIDNNSDGLIDQVNGPFGRSAYFQYDANDNLTKITDMCGYWSNLVYNTDVYLTNIENEKGQWYFRFEPADGIPNNSNPYPPPGDAMWENYRITITNPLGGRGEYHYNGAAGDNWYVSPRDYLHYIDSSNNNYTLAPKTVYFPTGSLVNGTSRIADIVRPEGGRKTFEYDILTGRVSIATETDGSEEQYTYNSNGLVTSFLDAKSNLTTFQYYPDNIDVWKIKYAPFDSGAVVLKM